MLDKQCRKTPRFCRTRGVVRRYAKQIKRVIITLLPPEWWVQNSILCPMIVPTVLKIISF